MTLENVFKVSAEDFGWMVLDDILNSDEDDEIFVKTDKVLTEYKESPYLGEVSVRALLRKIFDVTKYANPIDKAIDYYNGVTDHEIGAMRVHDFVIVYDTYDVIKADGEVAYGADLVKILRNASKF